MTDPTTSPDQARAKVKEAGARLRATLDETRAQFAPKAIAKRATGAALDRAEQTLATSTAAARRNKGKIIAAAASLGVLLIAKPLIAAHKNKKKGNQNDK